MSDRIVGADAAQDQVLPTHGELGKIGKAELPLPPKKDAAKPASGIPSMVEGAGPTLYPEQHQAKLKYPWMADYYGREDPKTGEAEIDPETGYIREGKIAPLAEGDQDKIVNRFTGETMASTKIMKNGTSKEALLDELPRHRAALARADLSNLDLHEVVLDRGNFREAAFNGCDLRGTSMTRSNLKGAEMLSINANGADLSYSDLREAKLTGSFRNCSFRGCDLRGAKLTGDIKGADFSGAILDDSDQERYEKARERIASGKPWDGLGGGPAEMR